MHPVDEAILQGTVTPELLRQEARKPLPPRGESYWGDAMRAVGPDADDPALSAARQAEREMAEVVLRMHRR